jgi:hypothetical protein
MIFCGARERRKFAKSLNFSIMYYYFVTFSFMVFGGMGFQGMNMENMFRRYRDISRKPVNERTDKEADFYTGMAIKLLSGMLDVVGA